MTVIHIQYQKQVHIKSFTYLVWCVRLYSLIYRTDINGDLQSFRSFFHDLHTLRTRSLPIFLQPQFPFLTFLFTVTSTDLGLNLLSCEEQTHFYILLLILILPFVSSKSRINFICYTLTCSCHLDPTRSNRNQVL